MATTACVFRNFVNLTSRIATANFRNVNPQWPISCRLLSYTSQRLSVKKYTDKHEWVAIDGKIGTIGITDYAQESLGDIVYAQLPDVGAEFEQSDECGALESVKAASELYCPLSGTVSEVNPLIEDQPGLINQQCYDDGWLFKLEMSNLSEADELLDEEAYAAFVKQEQE